MLTIRQALQLSCFSGAQIVAGESGLDQVIRHVHVVDIPDAVSSWGQGGLLLTSKAGLALGPERQRALVPTLAAQGLVGLAVAAGTPPGDVPPSIRRSAEQHGLPVIALPLETEFIPIIERLYIEIVSEQFAIERRSQDLQRQLTQIVLTGGNLAAVADALAAFLQRSVLMESTAFEVLAATQNGPIDEGRRLIVERGRSTPEQVTLFLKQGVYAEIHKQMRPIRMAGRPEVGMPMERVAAPIVAGGEIYGYIWVVAGDRPLTALDELAIESAATVAALLLLKDRAVRDAAQSLRGDFLAQLLGFSGPPTAALAEQAHQLGYRFEHAHQVLIMLLPPEHSSAQVYLAPQIESWLRREVGAPLVVGRERGIAAIVETTTEQHGLALAQRLIAELQTGVPTIAVGVSQICPPGQALRRCYDQAVEAASIGQRLALPSRACAFWQLGVLDWLYQLPAEALANNAYYRKVEQLAELDRRTQHGLLRSLEAYLECGGALSEAATTLNVHRNTLVYRLGRVEDLLGLELRQVDQRLNLHVALKGFRMRANGER
jgi:purine catabolism regulator